LNISLNISDAINRWRFDFGNLNIGYKDKFIIGIPTEFPQLQQDRKDIPIFIFPKHKSLILIDLFIPIFKKGRQYIIMDHRVNRRHYIIHSQIQHLRTSTITKQFTHLVVKRRNVPQRWLCQWYSNYTLLGLWVNYISHQLL